MHKYLIRFHKGTPSESTVMLEVNCMAESDFPACKYRDALEVIMKPIMDFDFTLCIRDGYTPEDYVQRC